MSRRPPAFWLALAASALGGGAGPAAAHEAFGDLGPLYGGLLHPLVDPLQGLMLVGTAAFLARQPLAAVRRAYPAFVAAGLLGLALSAAGVAPSSWPTLAAAFLVGLLALTALRIPGPAAALVCVAAGLAAGLAAGPFDPGREGVLAVAGAAAGLALLPLLLWATADLACRRIGPLAASVAGSWVVAVTIMTAALGV